MKRKSLYFQRICFLLAWTVVLFSLVPHATDAASPSAEAKEILDDAGVRGGLIVHVGCGDGRLTGALRASDGYLVHGLDRNIENVEKARKHIQSLGVYGEVTIDRLAGDRLPYIDNLVNLLVVEDPSGMKRDEMLRVLCPEGVAYIKRGEGWNKVVKPRPSEIDEWTHYLHDATGNPVAEDDVVGPPRHLQWVGGPRWSRHHDHMSSLSALVSSGGRIFYIMDEGPAASIELPPKWSLIARDAFNGTVLWKRPIEEWHTHLWPLKSGPAQLPRRLVAMEDKVYVTLGIDAPVSVLDAATGETLREYEKTHGAEEMILSESVLVVLVNREREQKKYGKIQDIKRWYGEKYWDEKPREIVALQADTGEVLWTEDTTVLPLTLVSDGKQVLFHNGECVVSLDLTEGEELWRSEPLSRSEVIQSFFAPSLVVYDGVVLFAGGERAGKQRGEWYTAGIDTMTALDAANGDTLWEAHHPPSGYRSPEDLIVVDDLVWTGETTSGRVLGFFRGRDFKTGEVRKEFIPDVDTYWFHHRCYRSKATERYLLTSRTGIEFIDPQSEHWQIHHWVRGACLYGIMPANGLIYAPPHPCACYLEAKLCGFNALAPALDTRQIISTPTDEERLDRGSAYEHITDENSDYSNEWPTYRCDAARSGYSPTEVPTDLNQAWDTEIGGELSSVVVADGKLFVASVNDHRVHALDADSGEKLWSFTASGRVDSPPTIHKRRVLFGAADGYVYCLRASDGALAWRFLAAPVDQRTVAYSQVESVWPVHGSVLIQDDTLYFVAGRSMFLDGGLYLWRLDPETGRVLSKTVFDEEDTATGKALQDYVSWLNMPTALSDVLSSDGRKIYMRSQSFDLEGKRTAVKSFPRSEDADRGAPPATQDPEEAHLFSPAGFLDNTWWHRSYWLYGSTYVSGWCGYYRAGKTAPAGRILTFDDTNVYGFGRKPQYYRWTTPLEHQLFAARKSPKLVTQTGRDGQSREVKQIEHLWNDTIPILVRSMTLAKDRLFVAGPPDFVDEEEILKRLDQEETQELLEKQAVALEGGEGSRLLIMSVEDGRKKAEYELDTIPVWDGMAAARGNLYIAAVDGRVICYKDN